jgi:DNA-binding PadR family transcriptional regulator
VKWSININQKQAIVLGIKNSTEAIILGMISDAVIWAEPQIIGSDVFYWTSRTKLANDLPLLDLKDDTIYRYLRSLEKRGLIVYKKVGLKDCVMLTTLGKTYSVEKKSESNKNSKKNPRESGKKSENLSKKNPTYTSTRSYPLTKDSSSSIPPQTECEDDKDEVEVYDSVLSSFIPPPALSHLSIGSIEEIVLNMCGKPNINNPARYKASILEKIKRGDAETIENILILANRIHTLDCVEKRKPWELEKRLKREEGERLSLALQSFGFNNPGEAYAVLEKAGQDDF